MSTYDLEEYTEKYVVGYGRFSGIKLTRLEEGFAEGQMPITKNHSNPWNTVHGGAIFTLADTIGGIAARSTGAQPTTCMSTISYLRPTVDCKMVTASAKVVKNGSNTIVVEISIYSDKGIHVSQVMATYFNLQL